MEHGTEDWPADGSDRLPLGFLMGALFAVCLVVSEMIVLGLARAGDVAWSFQEMVFYGMFGVVAVGYLVGLAAALHQPTRRLGFGILIGLTLTFPVTFLLGGAVMWGGA
jgi:hypothetical protein